MIRGASLKGRLATDYDRSTEVVGGWKFLRCSRLYWSILGQRIGSHHRGWIEVGFHVGSGHRVSRVRGADNEAPTAGESRIY